MSKKAISFSSLSSTFLIERMYDVLHICTVASSSSGSLSLHEFSQAKILEDKEFDYSSRSSFKEDAHTKFADIQPRQFYGPPALGFLDGICIKHEVGRFEYTICPFQNITNKRVSSHRISLLGKWDGWTIHDSTDPNLLYNYSLMSYGRGDACGGDTKSVTLTLDCGEEFNALEVVNVDENAGPCGYSIVLGLPIHCSLLLGSHPSVYLGNQNVKNTDNNSRGTHGHIEEGSDVSLSELLAVEESRLAEGGSFRTEDSTNTESYAEQVKALKKQVKDLTAQLEVALMAREVVE